MMDNAKVDIMWSDGMRIVDLGEVARQMYCRQCGLVLDLNRTVSEKRYGLASVLAIVCAHCQARCEVHTAKREEPIISEQPSTPQYEVNKRASVDLLLLENKQSVVFSFLALLNIPLQSPSVPQPGSESDDEELNFDTGHADPALSVKEGQDQEPAVKSPPPPQVIGTVSLPDDLSETGEHCSPDVVELSRNRCKTKSVNTCIEQTGPSKCRATKVQEQPPEPLAGSKISANRRDRSSKDQCDRPNTALSTSNLEDWKSDSVSSVSAAISSKHRRKRTQGKSPSKMVKKEHPSANETEQAKMKNGNFKSARMNGTDSNQRDLYAAASFSPALNSDHSRTESMDSSEGHAEKTEIFSAITGSEKGSSEKKLLSKEKESVPAMQTRSSSTRRKYSSREITVRTRRPRLPPAEKEIPRKDNLKCRVCGKTFRHAQGLAIHSKRMHPLGQSQGKIDSKEPEPVETSCLESEAEGKRSEGDEQLMQPVTPDEATSEKPEETSGSSGETDDIVSAGVSDSRSMEMPAERAEQQKDRDKQISAPYRYRCEQCSFGFRHSTEYTKHMLDKHGNKKPLRCEKCAEEFAAENQLKRHRKSHRSQKMAEPLGNQIHECTICLSVFPNGRRLRAHRTTHTPEERLQPLKRYTCEFCGEEFKRNYLYQIHLRYHTGEKPYKCLNCDESFTTKPQRTAHIRKCLTKKKIYLCELCGSRFGSLCTLRKHERVHTGAKPYSCHFCEQSFSRRNTLKIHERQHTGEAPYVCDQCAASFKQRVSLVTHLRSRHKINAALYSQPRDGPRYTHAQLIAGKLSANKKKNQHASNDLSSVSTSYQTNTSPAESNLPSVAGNANTNKTRQTSSLPSIAANYQTNSYSSGNVLTPLLSGEQDFAGLPQLSEIGLSLRGGQRLSGSTLSQTGPYLGQFGSTLAQRNHTQSTNSVCDPTVSSFVSEPMPMLIPTEDTSNIITLAHAASVLTPVSTVDHNFAAPQSSSANSTHLPLVKETINLSDIPIVAEEDMSMMGLTPLARFVHVPQDVHLTPSSSGEGSSAMMVAQLENSVGVIQPQDANLLSSNSASGAYDSVYYS